jgi:putative nucleotidyltransferase with HDIG domain
MPTIWVDVADGCELEDVLESGRLAGLLQEIACLTGNELIVQDGDRAPQAPDVSGGAVALPIRYQGRSAGSVRYTNGEARPALPPTVSAVRGLLEHAFEREAAVSDLARAVVTNFEELNLLYALLPDLANLEDPGEIGNRLVKESAQILNCRRVSLLVLDAERRNFQVLASLGLPPEARHTRIPVSGSVAGHALLEDDLLVVNDVLDRPDLSAVSRGKYDSRAFSVVRVPLQAQGEALGVLTATERQDDREFTTRDRRLLEGLSAVGASALMNCRLHSRINRQMLNTIEALALAVDAKDRYTHDHSARVAQFCVAMARELGIEKVSARREIRLAGLLHDIGKIGIADKVLSKTGRLTAEELAIVRDHVRIGARIVGRVEGLEAVAAAVLHHHERYDGLGYPQGLARDSIPMMARLIAVADVFDCLTSDRPYRKATTAEAALAEVRRCKGTQFDPEIVESFVAVAASRAGRQLA